MLKKYFAALLFCSTLALSAPPKLQSIENDWITLCNQLDAIRNATGGGTHDLNEDISAQVKAARKDPSHPEPKEKITTLLTNLFAEMKSKLESMSNVTFQVTIAKNFFFFGRLMKGETDSFELFFDTTERLDPLTDELICAALYNVFGGEYREDEPEEAHCAAGSDPDPECAMPRPAPALSDKAYSDLFSPLFAFMTENPDKILSDIKIQNYLREHGDLLPCERCPDGPQPCAQEIIPNLYLGNSKFSEALFLETFKETDLQREYNLNKKPALVVFVGNIEKRLQESRSEAKFFKEVTGAYPQKSIEEIKCYAAISEKLKEAHLLAGSRTVKKITCRGIEILYLPLVDGPRGFSSFEQSFVPEKELIFNHIRSNLNANKPVLIHCLDGVQRGPTVCFSFLYEEARKLDPSIPSHAVFLYIRSKRPVIQNAGMIFQALTHYHSPTTAAESSTKAHPPIPPTSSSAEAACSVRTPPFSSPSPLSPRREDSRDQERKEKLYKIQIRIFHRLANNQRFKDPRDPIEPRDEPCYQNDILIVKIPEEAIPLKVKEPSENKLFREIIKNLFITSGDSLFDLPDSHSLETLLRTKKRPALVICLDSSCKKIDWFATAKAEPGKQTKSMRFKGIPHLYLPLDAPKDFTEHFVREAEDIFSRIHDELLQDNPVIILCRDGLERSTAVCFSFLIHEGEKYKDTEISMPGVADFKINWHGALLKIASSLSQELHSTEFIVEAIKYVASFSK